MKTAASPWITTVSLAPPSLQDNTADTDRLISALKTSLQTDAAIRIDLDPIKGLPDILRQNNFRVRCILFKVGRRPRRFEPDSFHRIFGRFGNAQ
jgi:hypothetical protein